MRSYDLIRSGALVASMTACAAHQAQAQTQVNFGEERLFDFGALLPETRFGWSSGDALIANINLHETFGGITGNRDKQITPPLIIAGETIIPEVRADTRSGLKVTTDFTGQAGVELYAGVTTGGQGMTADLIAGPTLTLNDPTVAGQFINMRADTELSLTSVFDPGLPRLDAGINAVLNGDFQNTIEYGAFPLVGYDVGEFGFDFDFDFNLFNLDFDLSLPKIPIPEFPDLPTFTIPESERDNTAFRQKIPASNPVLSVGEIAIDNPFYSVSDEASYEDGVARYKVGGSLVRAGIDIDGIASALLSGGISFTSGEEEIKGVKFKFDVIDVKYGLEVGFNYESEIDTALNMTLNFDRDVLIKEADGTETITDTYSGRWDQLPDIALLDRTDVNVDVDFTDIEAFFSQGAELTLSDYMELQALKLSAKYNGVGPSVGPLYYQKFPLAGELAAFELFSTNPTSLGSLGLLEGLWDSSFVLEAQQIKEVYLNPSAADVGAASSWFDIDTGVAPTTLTDKTLILGIEGADPVNSRLDLQSVYFSDPGKTRTVILSYLLGFRVTDYEYEIQDFENKTKIDGLVNLGTYDVNNQGIRQFELNYIENDGRIQGFGFLGISTANTLLSITGDGQIDFKSPGEISADWLLHGESHTIVFENISSTDPVELFIPIQGSGLLVGVQPSSYAAYHNIRRDFRTNHNLDLGRLTNDGTIRVDDTILTLSASPIHNNTTGTLEATNGGVFTINPTSSTDYYLYNSGLIRADGAGSRVNINHQVIQPVNSGEFGRILAENGGHVRFNSPSVTTDMLNQHVEAGNGGLVTFADGLFAVDGVTLTTQVGGEMTFSDGFEVLDYDGLNIVNHGTMNIDGIASLIPSLPDPNSGDGSTIRPLNLVNTGTINVRNGGAFRFGVELIDFANDGAKLEGGTWNAIGTPGTFSNLTTPANGMSRIDVRVLDVLPGSDYLGEVFDLSVLDTSLKTSAANVMLSGAAVFQYLNTIQTNQGTLHLTQGHQFTTAGTYTNEGGTTLVDFGGDLFVQGALKVHGGLVYINSGSSFTADTVTETQVNEETNESFDEMKTVEVIGGELRVLESGFLPISDMFTDRSGVGVMDLNAGQYWAVRESVSVDPITAAETVTPGTINLGIVSIAHNNGHITIDGSSATFDAAESITNNYGSLNLLNGHVFNSTSTVISNDGELIMRGAQFKQSAASSSFINAGHIEMDGDSYIKTDQFTNLSGGTVLLDGILDAQTVTINASSSISGAGSITGSIINNGTLDLGNSPGIIESFGGYSQGNAAELLVEIQGFTAGESFDQLIVKQLTAANGEPTPPQPIVSLDGVLRLDFDLDTEENFSWIVVDNEGTNALTGNFEPEDILVTGLTIGDPDEKASPNEVGDHYLGALNRFAYYLTYEGGDGNDLAVYTDSIWAADMDGDGYVDEIDLILAIDNFTGSSGSGMTFEDGDWDGDGDIDNKDLGFIIGAFDVSPIEAGVPEILATNGLAAIPEPSSMSLLGISGLLMLRRRRRCA